MSVMVPEEEINPSSDVDVNIGYVRSMVFVQELHNPSVINKSIVK
jgi:hypothetical protein